jgi:hypothetical protein
MCFRVKTYFTTANAATKLVPFKLMAISNSSSLKQSAILKHENAIKSLSNNVGGPRITQCFKAFKYGVSSPILIDALPGVKKAKT